MSVISLSYTSLSLALTLLVMSQSPDATKVDSQANAWDFPYELLANAINSLGSGYLHPISGLSNSVERGQSVGRRILRLRQHRRLKVEVRIKIKIKIIQSRSKQ